MPAQTLEQVKQRETKIREAVSGHDGSAEPDKGRKLGKKLRRAQRKRRRLAVNAERIEKLSAAKKAAAEKPAEAPAEKKPEAPAE